MSRSEVFPGRLRRSFGPASSYRGEIYVHFKPSFVRAVRAQLVLLKYPVFLVMTVPCHLCPRLAIAAVLAYAALSVYHWLDDRQLRKARGK